jgi:hypothetical protein
MKKRDDPNPLVKCVVRVRNPAWDVEIGKRAAGFAHDLESTPGSIDVERECEILVLNVNTGGMRVRFTDNEGKIKTQDISNEYFFNQYSIVRKTK